MLLSGSTIMFPLNEIKYPWRRKELRKVNTIPKNCFQFLRTTGTLRDFPRLLLSCRLSFKLRFLELSICSVSVAPRVGLGSLAGINAAPIRAESTNIHLGLRALTCSTVTSSVCKQMQILGPCVPRNQPASTKGCHC